MECAISRAGWQPSASIRGWSDGSRLSMPASGAAFPDYSTSITTKYIHPTSLSTTSSAEALLGVIAGGSGTLGGPVAGAALVLLLKNYASAYVERWNMLLGLVFLLRAGNAKGIVPGVSSLVAKLRGVSR